jgi:hypothetical protein
MAFVALAAVLAGGAEGRPSPPRPEHQVTAQELVYRVPGMDQVKVRRDIPFRRADAGDLTLDLYYPPDLREAARPAVVFINGVGDRPGSKLKDWGIYGSWGRLVAASGWIAVTHEARGPHTESGPQIRDLFRFLRSGGARLGLDANRIAAWVCSGNVLSGLPVLMEEAHPGILGAAVYYGSAEPSKIRTDFPVFFVRAGRDNPRLNAEIDRLWAKAIAAGAPWTLVNAPALHHAFDALDETAESRRIVRQTLEFFRDLFAPPEASGAPSPARRALSHWFGREYSEAAAAYGEYVKTHPDDATAYLRLGLSQAHLKRVSEAEANLQKAVALGADSPADFYNVACGYALAGQKEKALDWLERAVAAGFQDRRLMASDEDLESLRGLDRFQKLVEKLE